MFKFKSKSYNVKKESGKNESGKNEKEGAKASSSSSSSSSSSTSSSTGTLRKNPHVKTKPSAEEIKYVNNKSSPQYLKKSSSGTEWHKNKTFSAKTETKKLVIPTPHKKLERK